MTTAEDVRGRVAQRAQGSEVAQTEPMPSAQQERPQSIGELIQKLRPELQRAIPKGGMDADRLARLALTVVRKVPQLAECTMPSFAGALLTAASLGLEPHVNGECWLVPYRDKRRGVVECQFIIGYQGFAKLFWQHPMAQTLDAQAVHANDTFDYAYGLKPRLEHIPAREPRGEVIYYYAVATLTTGGTAFVVLTPEQVKELRKGKVGPSGDIADPMQWMERKTAVRQLMKLLPKSANLVAAIEKDERDGSELYREHMTQVQIAAAEPPRAIEGQVVEGGTVDETTGVITPPASEEPPHQPPAPEGQDGPSFEEVRAQAKGTPQPPDETGGADPENDTSWPTPAEIPNSDPKA